MSHSTSRSVGRRFIHPTFQLLMVWLVVILAPLGAAGQTKQVQDRPIARPLAQNVVDAWTKAGGELFWVKPAKRSAEPKPEPFPVFHFAEIKGKLEELPVVDVPFGLRFFDLQTAERLAPTFRDAQLKALVRQKNLRTLDVGNTRITDAGLKELAGLKLRALDLPKLAKTDLGLKHYLAVIERPAELDLTYWDIRAESLQPLAGWNLKRLQLPDGVRSDIGLEHYLAALEPLQELRLTGNPYDRSAWKITNVGMKSVAKQKQLQWLSLDNLKVGDDGLKELAGLTELQKLDLATTQITDAGLKHLAGLTKLQSLSLPPAITDAGLAELAPLTDLRTLHLQSAKITDAGLARLAPLAQLRELNLRGTRVTDAGLKHLLGLKYLESLNLYSTQVSTQGVRQLAAMNLKQLVIPSEYDRATPQRKKSMDAISQYWRWQGEYQESMRGGPSNAKIEIQDKAKPQMAAALQAAIDADPKYAEPHALRARFRQQYKIDPDRSADDAKKAIALAPERGDYRLLQVELELPRDSALARRLAGEGLAVRKAELGKSPRPDETIMALALYAERWDELSALIRDLATIPRPVEGREELARGELVLRTVARAEQTQEAGRAPGLAAEGLAALKNAYLQRTAKPEERIALAKLAFKAQQWEETLQYVGRARSFAETSEASDLQRISKLSLLALGRVGEAEAVLKDVYLPEVEELHYTIVSYDRALAKDSASAETYLQRAEARMKWRRKASRSTQPLTMYQAREVHTPERILADCDAAQRLGLNDARLAAIRAEAANEALVVKLERDPKSVNVEGSKLLEIARQQRQWGRPIDEQIHFYDLAIEKDPKLAGAYVERAELCNRERSRLLEERQAHAKYETDYARGVVKTIDVKLDGKYALAMILKDCEAAEKLGLKDPKLTALRNEVQRIQAALKSDSQPRPAADPGGATARSDVPKPAPRKSKPQPEIKSPLAPLNEQLAAVRALAEWYIEKREPHLAAGDWLALIQRFPRQREVREEALAAYRQCATMREFQLAPVRPPAQMANRPVGHHAEVLVKMGVTASDPTRILGWLALELGQYADAHQLLNSALQHEEQIRKQWDAALPDPLVYWHRYVHCRRQVEVLSRVVGNPQDAVGLAQRANAWAILGENDKAVADYSRVLEKAPKSVLARCWRAGRYIALGNYAAAQADIDAALALHPQCGDAYACRGALLQAQMRFDDALAAYAKAIELNPRRQEAHVRRGLIFYYRGQLDDVAEEHTLALNAPRHEWSLLLPMRLSAAPPDQQPAAPAPGIAASGKLATPLAAAQLRLARGDVLGGQESLQLMTNLSNYLDPALRLARGMACLSRDEDQDLFAYRDLPERSAGLANLVLPESAVGKRLRNLYVYPNFDDERPRLYRLFDMPLRQEQFLYGLWENNYVEPNPKDRYQLATRRATDTDLVACEDILAQVKQRTNMSPGALDDSVRVSHSNQTVGQIRVAKLALLRRARTAPTRLYNDPLLPAGYVQSVRRTALHELDQMLRNARPDKAEAARFATEIKEVGSELAALKIEIEGLQAKNPPPAKPPGAVPPAGIDPELFAKAEGGNPGAQYRVGYLLYQAEEWALARIWLEKAANQGSRPAMSYLASLDRRDKSAPSSGNPAAVPKSAQSVAEIVVEVDPQLLADAKSGNARAMYAIAMNHTLQQKWDQAKLWLERADAAGYGPPVKQVLAHVEKKRAELAAQKSEPKPTPPPAQPEKQQVDPAQKAPDIQKIYQLARKSPDAQVRADNRRLLEKEGEAGNARAQCLLGNIFFAERNNEQAFKWYSKAANQGDASGQWLVGLSYLNGDGVPKDPTRAREWLEKAAAQKHPEAQAQLEKLKTP